MAMDKWQEHVLGKCRAFLKEGILYEEKEVQISLNQREAYVVMKALEQYGSSELEIMPNVRC